MATATMSSDKELGDSHIPRTPSSGSSSEGSDFVILSRPPEGNNLGSPNDFQVGALMPPFANGGDVSTMMNAEHLMSAFNGLKQENTMLKGQLTEMNKTMQSRIAEIQTMRDDQSRMNKDLKEKHQKAKKAVTHYQEQNKKLSEHLKELLEKENQNTTKQENMQTEISQLQVQLRNSQAAALSRSAPPTSTSTSASNSETTTSAPSSLLTQMQEDLKNARETRADIKKELQQMEEAGRQSEEALQKVNDTELQRLQQVVKRKDEEKADLLKMNQELQQQVDTFQKKGIQEGLRASNERQRPQDGAASLPSSQGEGFIEEEQGFSLMNDSAQFAVKPAVKEFEKDIMEQLQKERERSDKLSTELKAERARVAKLEKDLHTSSQQLMERSFSYDEDISEIQQKHQTEVEDLERKVDELSMVAATAAQEPRHNSGVELKQQVRSLVGEIQSREADIKDRDVTINSLNAEVAALRAKIGMYHDDMEKDREQNTQLVESLQGELTRLQRLLETQAAELHTKDTMFRGEKQKALHAGLEHDRLQEESERMKEEFDQLFADYDNLTRNYEELRVKHTQMQPMLARQREITEQQDGLVARLLSAEEAIKAKDEENQKLKQDIQHMKNDLETIPVLRAQAEVYKADFDAERAAREKIHADKEVLMNELETLRAECEQAQQEAANQAQPRVLEMMRRHGGDAHGGAGQQGPADYGLHTGGGLDPWGTYQPYGNDVMHNNLYGDDQAGAEARGNREGGQQHGHLQQPGTLDRNVTCPKCMEQFPDMDTLQIHMLDCIQ